MSVNQSPIYVGLVKCWQAQIATANTGLDGSGTVGTILSAGTAGSRIDLIRVKATATTTAGMIRLFLHDGSVYRLWQELEVSAVTPSATVKAFSIEIVPTAPLLLLPTGWSLRASTHNAETFNVFAFGGDF